MKGFYVTDSCKIKLQVCKCPLSLSWWLCMTVCFHVNRVCNSSAVGAGTVQTVSTLCFSFLSADSLHYFLPFHNCACLPKCVKTASISSLGCLFSFSLFPSPKTTKKPKLWMLLWRKGSVSLKNTLTLHEGFKRITLKQWNPLETLSFFPVVTLSLPHLGSWNCRWRKTHGAIVYSFFLMGQSIYFQCNVIFFFFLVHLC